MPEFKVKWEVDLTADTPRNAARMARLMQTAEDTTATVFEVAGAFGAEPVTIDLSVEQPDERLVPDFQMDVTGEYTGNPYPEQREYRITMTTLGTGEDFALVVEDVVGGVVNSITLSLEDADGINKVAHTEHSLSVYEDDWQIPVGIERQVYWDLGDGENFIQITGGQIEEIADWLEYAVGEKTWDWAEQGEEWVS